MDQERRRFVGFTAGMGYGMIAIAFASCGKPPSPQAPVAPGTATSSAAPVPDDAARRPDDLVYPVTIEHHEVTTAVDPSNDVNGVEGGVEDGAVGGDLDGVVAAPPPPPPPPPPRPPQNVAPTSLEANRMAGTKNIVPDDVTKVEIQRARKTKLVGTWKLCVTPEGNIGTVAQLKSTGFPAYDATITKTIRGEWRYRPFLVNGQPAPVCTAVTFIYSQLPAPEQKKSESRTP